MTIDFLQADDLTLIVAKRLSVALDVVVHKTLDSTNSWCLRQSKSGKLLPFACFAEQQTSGRGRGGKQWHMSAYSNIAMSLAWPFVLTGRSLHLLPLCIALAIAETLESLGIKQVQIKWPNDVYVKEKKIAGILIETQTVKCQQTSACIADEKSANDKYWAVVIGVGLNYQMVNSDKMKTDELLVLTDIFQQVELQKIMQKPTRSRVAATLLCNVVNACQNFCQASGDNLEKFRASYDFCKDKEVDIILDNGEVLTGIAQGVNENAELLVLMADELRVFNSADVSVRATMSRDGRDVAKSQEGGATKMREQ